jgi:hypothetical protein
VVEPLQHPRERMTRHPPPKQPDGIEPLQVLTRTDGRVIVYDPRLPLGKRTAWEGDSVAAGGLEAQRMLRPPSPSPSPPAAAPDCCE